MALFQELAGRRHQRTFSSYQELHQWSVAETENFWGLWLRESGVQFTGSCDRVHTGDGFAERRWFPDVSLSFAFNLLAPALQPSTAHTEALVGVDESDTVVRMSFVDLARAVIAARARLAPVLEPGERVAAVLPNRVEAVILMLATVSLGALWSSASPDFGEAALLDRFGQIEPSVLLAVDHYQYGRQRFSVLPAMTKLCRELPTLRAAFMVGSEEEHLEGFEALSPTDAPSTGMSRPQELTSTERATLRHFPQFPFDHPLYVLFSSGTTGKPKCIVHGAGGTLLQHRKEHSLHSDIRTGDRVLYFTTCGWMMWNWLASVLAGGATALLYDGSPMSPRSDRLWNLVQQESISHLGVSPRYLAACRKTGIDARDRSGSLRVLFSTGAPLLPEDFDYVYTSLAPEVQLASISGGTDIISCFVLGVPTLPVRRGEIQAAGLGMDVAAVDDQGTPLLHRRGELVCRTPFPSRPLGFWGDDGSGYHAAYFQGFPGWWTHGDYVEITGTVGSIGGVVIHGRSDATLNPGGVRIGTAEIYRQVEGLPEVRDSLVVGKPVRGDVEVVLFVVLASGSTEVPSDLEASIRRRIRYNASPRHVPKRIVAVSAIPYTRSGKKVELAVRDVLSGTEPGNLSALADPSVLEEYRAFAQNQ